MAERLRDINPLVELTVVNDYIKDQKSVTVRVNNVKYDDNDKITELELIKK